jgi:hypothetical protein
VNITLDLSHLHPFQVEFLECRSEYQGFFGGAGIGKSEAAAIKLVIHAISYPGSKGFYGSATWLSMTGIFLRVLRRILGQLPSWMWVEEKGIRQFTFWNGSEILYRNLANPENTKSLNLDIAVIEEGTEVTNIEDVFFAMERGLRNQHGPQQLIVVSNPGLKSHFLYDFFFNKPAANKWAVSHPARLGVHQSDEYLRRLASMPKSRRLSLEGGEWGVREGAAFPFIDIREVPFADLQQWFISFDYGFSPDPMVYLLIGVNGKRMHIARELTLFSMPTPRHAALLQPWFDEVNITAYTGELATGAGEVRSMFNENFKIIHRQTDKRRDKGAVLLTDMAAESDLSVDPSCTDTIASLQSLIWVKGSKHSDVITDKESAAGDDHYDAARYGAMTYIGNHYYIPLTVHGLHTGKVQPRGRSANLHSPDSRRWTR